MKETSKRKFTQSRWFIFLLTYASLVVVLIPPAVLEADGELYLVGHFLAWGGGMVVVIGFLLLDRDSTWFKPLIAFEEGRYFRRRNHLKDYDRVIVVIIAAGAAVFYSGYLWVRYIAFYVNYFGLYLS